MLIETPMGTPFGSPTSLQRKIKMKQSNKTGATKEQRTDYGERERERVIMRYTLTRYTLGTVYVYKYI